MLPSPAWSPPPPMSGPVLAPAAESEPRSWVPSAVTVDEDFARIAAIPRQPWDEAPDLLPLTAHLTSFLLRPGSEKACPGGVLNQDLVCSKCGSPTALRPIQAAALRAFYDVGGLFASMSVGSGKTLVTLLAPTLLGAQWPLLIVPSSLIEKTLHEVLILAKHWRLHPAFIQAATCSTAERKRNRECLLSYAELSRKAGALKLIKADPDFVALDECQMVKNRSAACTKKISRAIKHWRKPRAPPAHTLHTAPGSSAALIVPGPQAPAPAPSGSASSGPRRVIVGALSGSVAGRSFGECWGPMRWSLGQHAPLPLDLKSFLSWCYALDEKIPDMSRLDPGPLTRLSPDAKGETPLQLARDAYASRFASCPGVISSKDAIPPYGLEISIEHVPAPAPVREAVEYLRANWATPDGNEFELALELWARERWLSHGGWFCWDPLPPSEWKNKRKAYKTFERDTLKAPWAQARGIDSPEIVEDEIKAGRLPAGAAVWEEWDRIKPTFEANSVWNWLGPGAHVLLERAAAWLMAGERRIVWLEREPLGQALSAMTGVPYYHRGACDERTGEHVKDAKGRAICSIASCSVGQNLQFEFSHNYLLELPPKGAMTEQLLGRTHRPGQSDDSGIVTVTIPLMTEGDLKGLLQNLADARYAFENRREPQKLLYGTWLQDPEDFEGELL